MREDAHYPPQDGKTPWSFTTPCHCVLDTLVERRWEPSGANGTPPWRIWNTNLDPYRVVGTVAGG